jgi:transglutaminase-like putative cysteine protease
MAFGILALSAGLFFVLPRTARAALERFLPGSSRVSGFSEEISLGEGGAILKSSTAVMHVRFTETNQPPLLRWRGATLAEFDGQRWYNSERQARALYPEKELLQLADDEQRRRPGLRFTAQIWMHGGTDLLFLAGRPEFLRVPVPVVYETAGGALRVARDTDGLQYILFNYVNLGDRLSMGGEALDPQSRNFYLRLPPVDPRVFDLARRITQGYQLDRDRAAAIEHFLRTKLSYSLDNNPPPGVDPLSWFLFDRRRGHCEYFASAMAVMLRLSWIPARVATGYLPGDFNPISGWHVIRASHAHAWVEAWLPGEGWVVFDPTPPSLQTAPTGLMSRLSLYLDAADMFWREWVIGYDLERQLTLAFRVDQSRRRLRLPSFEQFFAGWSGRFRQWQKGVEHGEALPIAVLLLVAAGALGFWAWLGRGAWLRRRFRRGQASRHDATVLYQQMLTLLRRRGLVKPAAYTPLEFARMAGEVPTAQAVEEFTHAYYEVRFRGSESAAARLPALLESIERLTR